MTHLAGCDDRGYGQGVCAGDVNQDGFPDLLVANIGANRLYLNQGDGTFRDATANLASDPNDWTSSIGIGDLDGDGLPEIVEVNYINDPDAFEIKCEGREIRCQPQSFRAATDRIQRARGDGSYEPWASMTAGDPLPNYGFSLIIANLDGRFGNDLFISNDGDLNHYWVSETANQTEPTATAAARFALVESAVSLGCSIGVNGQAQACMGVAAADFDRNHRPDLHVTNFHNEPVNLYLQQDSGYFIDQGAQVWTCRPDDRLTRVRDPGGRFRQRRMARSGSAQRASL